VILLQATRHGERMGEAMVLIRTFHTEEEAGTAREELKASGIHSLLFAEDTHDTAGPGTGVAGVHLAVHQRDQNIAEAVLNAVLEAE
jgi:hypothetical protein